MVIICWLLTLLQKIKKLFRTLISILIQTKFLAAKLFSRKVGMLRNILKLY